MRRCIIPILAFVLMLAAASCGIYSFSGASIPPEAKTISITHFPNNAAIVNPSLSQAFTDMLKDKFTNQTSLSLVTRNGDLQIEGEITGYNVQPVAIQGNDQAALNRLTVTVNVRYQNKYAESQNFESSFSRFADFPAAQSLSSVQQTLLEEINKALVEDIFNKSVANW
ncbi:MAG TPA: LptE family protein [Bacteroidales bacterium]|nr:LptE family protein [Bacteroidales bacterium]HSA43067.1 LptE family protein [Bacteroidales bacterium]